MENGTLLSDKENELLIYDKMNTSQNNFTQWNKPERKEHILYDSIIHSSDIGYLQMGLEGSMDWKEA